MKIVYSFASRSREHQFFDVLMNVKALSASDNYEIIAKLDTDDRIMNNERVLTKIREEHPEVRVKLGLSTSKIHAVNRDLSDMGECGLVVNLSDDQKFIAHGFDDIMRNNVEEGKHFFHYMENMASNRVAVLNVTTKEYYDQRGFIYHPDYFSLWADEEETIIAQMKDVYKLCNESIFEHYHYSQSDKTKRIFKDKLYERNDTYRSDERVFIKRKARNFDIINPNINN